MAKHYELFKFFNFCILIKRQYVNSIVLGTPNEISNKINTSYYLTRKYINYGLKNGLITKTSNGYRVASYNTLIDSLGLKAKRQNYSFYKTGNFQSLLISNSLVIAMHEFKAQDYKIKQKKKVMSIRERIATGQRITKKEYEFSKKSCDNLYSSIITGQKHLAKILGFSQQTCYNLMKLWNSFGLIKRTVIFSNRIDEFNLTYVLNLNRGRAIVMGSKISLNPLVVTFF